jgi:hypothetical protein
MNESDLLDREMAFTRQHHTDYSCNDPSPTLRECRRFKNHEGQHASGYGNNRIFWE